MSSLLRRMVSGLLVVTSGSVMATVFSMLATVLVAEGLGPTGFGLLTLAFSSVNIASIFLDLGIGTVVISDSSAELGNKEPGKAKRLLKGYFKMQMIMGVLLSLLLVLFSVTFAGEFFPSDVIPLIQISAIFLFMTAIQNFFKICFFSFSKFFYFEILNVMQSVSRFVIILVFVLLNSLDVTTALISYPLSILSSVLLSTPFLIKTLRAFKGVKPHDQKIFRTLLLSHGKYAMLQQPINKVSDNIAPWIIQFILGLESVAFFSLAQKFYTVLNIGMTSLDHVLIPLVSEKMNSGKESIVRLFKKTMKYSVFLSVPIILFVFFLVPPIIRFEPFGLVDYVPSIEIIQVLSLTLIITGLNRPIRSIYYALKGQRYLFPIQTLRMVFIAAYGALLLSIMQEPIGMAWGVVLGSLTVFPLRYFWLLKLDRSFKLNLRRDIFSIDSYDRNIFRRLKKGIPRKK